MPGGYQKLEKGYGKSVVEFKANRGLGGAHRLVNASTWTDYINVSKLFACDMEHALEMLPVSDVRLLEECFGRGLRVIGMIGYKLLSFRT